jgi:hypothetical protein
MAAAATSEASDLHRWTKAILASDSLDVVASVASIRSIGKVNSVGAAAIALLAVSGDIWAIRTIHRFVD